MRSAAVIGLPRANWSRATRPRSARRSSTGRPTKSWRSAGQRAARHDEKLDSPKPDAAQGMPGTMSDDGPWLARRRHAAGRGICAGRARCASSAAVSRCVWRRSRRCAPRSNTGNAGWAGSPPRCRPVEPPPQAWSASKSALSAAPRHRPPAASGTAWRSGVGCRRIGSRRRGKSCGAVGCRSRRYAECPLVAKLDAPAGGGFVAAIDSSRNGLTIVPASIANVNQRVLELWLIAPGDKPRSLGLIEPGRAGAHQIAGRHVAARRRLNRRSRFRWNRLAVRRLARRPARSSRMASSQICEVGTSAHLPPPYLSDATRRTGATSPQEDCHEFRT